MAMPRSGAVINVTEKESTDRAASIAEEEDTGFSGYGIMCM
jgi:hypothetical protein